MRENATNPLWRAGDVVHHEPSGEDWALLRVDETHIVCAGWPRSRALRSDCTLLQSCTDAEHEKMVEAAGRAARDF